MNITLQAESINKESFEKFKSELSNEGATSEIVTVGTKASLSQEHVEFISFIVSALSNLALNVLASYLYDFLKNPKSNVKIDNKDVKGKSIEEIKEQLIPKKKSRKRNLQNTPKKTSNNQK